MLKTYQFKTHCKGDSHSSKLQISSYQDSWQNKGERLFYGLTCTHTITFKFKCMDVTWNNFCRRIWILLRLYTSCRCVMLFLRLQVQFVPKVTVNWWTLLVHLKSKIL